MPAAGARVGAARLPAPIYIAAGLSGLTALGAQVVWTRLLTLLFGATVYAFAIILAVFLAGLGIGSAIASYHAAPRAEPGCAAWRGRSSRWCRRCCWAASCWRACSPTRRHPRGRRVGALHALHVVRAVIVILPGAIFWGMSFPFALAAAARAAATPAARAAATSTPPTPSARSSARSR